MSWDATALAVNDNVATVLGAVAARDSVRVRTPDGIVEVIAREAIPLCHKIALRDLAPGDLVVKYGESIGVATVRIDRGAWVHVHNLRSQRAQPPDSGA